MARLILPLSDAKQGVFEEDLMEKNLYFLAGPIKGGGNWQEKAINILAEKDPSCIIACPVRYPQDHRLWRYVGPKDEIPFPEIKQLNWERNFMDGASRFGCIIFWLPEEDKENPRPKSEGPYAQDTYGELGRWSVRSALKNKIYHVEHPNMGEPIIHLVIGAEANFPGLRTIQKNLDRDHRYDFPIYASLEETITRAIEHAKSGKNLVY